MLITEYLFCFFLLQTQTFHINPLVRILFNIFMMFWILTATAYCVVGFIDNIQFFCILNIGLFICDMQGPWTRYEQREAVYQRLQKLYCQVKSIDIAIYLYFNLSIYLSIHLYLVRTGEGEIRQLVELQRSKLRWLTNLNSGTE